MVIVLLHPNLLSSKFCTNSMLWRWASSSIHTKTSYFHFLSLECRNTSTFCSQFSLLQCGVSRNGHCLTIFPSSSCRSNSILFWSSLPALVLWLELNLILFHVVESALIFSDDFRPFSLSLLLSTQPIVRKNASVWGLYGHNIVRGFCQLHCYSSFSQCPWEAGFPSKRMDQTWKSTARLRPSDSNWTVPNEPWKGLFFPDGSVSAG